MGNSIEVDYAALAELSNTLANAAYTVRTPARKATDVDEAALASSSVAAALRDSVKYRALRIETAAEALSGFAQTVDSSIESMQDIDEQLAERD